MAGFVPFTEASSNYNFHYYSIPGQPYARFSKKKKKKTLFPTTA
jgi:hypothetical protein